MSFRATRRSTWRDLRPVYPLRPGGLSPFTDRGQAISLTALVPAVKLPQPLPPVSGPLSYLVSVESTAASVSTKAVPSSSVTAGPNARRLAIQSLLADYPSAFRSIRSISTSPPPGPPASPTTSLPRPSMNFTPDCSPGSNPENRSPKFRAVGKALLRRASVAEVFKSVRFYM